MQIKVLALSLFASLPPCAPSEVDSPLPDTGIPDAGAPDSSDATSDGGPSERPDDRLMHDGLLLPTCESTEPDDSVSLEQVASTLVATVVPESARAIEADPLLNPSHEGAEAQYMSMGLADYRAGEGNPHVRRTDLGGERGDAARRSLAYFVHYSDFQLVDDESPQRWCSLDNTMWSGSMRPQESLLPRAVSAMNRTFARLEGLTRDFDFGIVTGDCADSAQLNESKWVIDIMDGATAIHTDSGEDDDPVPGPNNDAKDPFDAVAFPAPWLYVPGNHDVEVVGVGPPSVQADARAVGSNPQNGTRDYRRWYAPVTTRNVPADPNRTLVERDDIVALLRESPSIPGPVGHGYAADADTTHGANYAYDAIPGVLRIISIDTSDPSGGSVGMIRQPQMDAFLRPELDRALAEGMVVMLASHHSTGAMDRRISEFGNDDPEALEPAAIETFVASYSNVVAWLVGHTHANRIRAVAGTDAEHPGYWEIMTSALADWPGQARAIELVDNGNGTLSIYGTLVDFDESNCMERRYRRLMLMDMQSGWSELPSTDPGFLNVELVRPISKSITASVSSAASFAEIESETGLKGF